MLHNTKRQIETNFSLKELTFFKVGGKCDLFFSPQDIEDLKIFLQNSAPMEIICLGAMSNVLILDSGFTGCVISTRNTFNEIEFLEGRYVKVGSGVFLSKFILHCIKNEVSCCEQMFCIPGTIGGALVMNAGTPSFEIFDVLIEIHCIDFDGNVIIIPKKDIKNTYRNGNIPKNLIITSCILETTYMPEKQLQDLIHDIRTQRLKSQPITTHTCGSTFKNPKGLKAWQLIDSAGCRGIRCGGAVISDLHCNFIINDNNATSDDILRLMQIVKEKVFSKHGVMLEEEIKIIGNNKND